MLNPYFMNSPSPTRNFPHVFNPPIALDFQLFVKFLLALGIASKWIKGFRKSFPGFCSFGPQVIDSMQQESSALEMPLWNQLSRGICLFSLLAQPPFNLVVTSLYHGCRCTFSAHPSDGAVSSDSHLVLKTPIKQGLSVAYLHICLQLLHIRDMCICVTGKSAKPPSAREVGFPGSVSSGSFHPRGGVSEWVVDSHEC